MLVGLLASAFKSFLVAIEAVEVALLMKLQ
jgi:hypothetical protein